MVTWIGEDGLYHTTAASGALVPCRFCSYGPYKILHKDNMCPNVKAVEYFSEGQIKRIEYFGEAPKCLIGP